MFLVEFSSADDCKKGFCCSRCRLHHCPQASRRHAILCTGSLSSKLSSVRLLMMKIQYLIYSLRLPKKPVCPRAASTCWRRRVKMRPRSARPCASIPWSRRSRSRARRPSARSSCRTRRALWRRFRWSSAATRPLSCLSRPTLPRLSTASWHLSLDAAVRLVNVRTFS